MTETQIFRRQEDYDHDHYKKNISRMFLERDGIFNTTSRDNRESQNYIGEKKYPKNNKYGEITGEKLTLDDIDKGMPLRFSNYNNINNQEVINPVLDFDLYETKSNINVSYFDPGSINSNFTELYKSEINYLDRLTGHIFNNFNYDKTFVISPINIIQPIVVLYRASSNNTELNIKKSLKLPPKTDIFDKYDEIIKKLKINNKNLIIKSMLIFKEDTAIHAFYVNFVKNITDIIKIKYKPADIIDVNNLFMFHNVLNPNNIRSGLNIVSTCYYRNQWVDSFDPKLTYIDSFNNSERKIYYMKKLNTLVNYYEDNRCQVAELKSINHTYVGFILPKIHNYVVDNNFIFDLKSKIIDMLVIPKFNHESKFNVYNLLKKLNLDLNLNEIHDITSDKCSINSLIHQIKIEIDESGSNNNYNTKLKSKNNINFILNREFLYYVKYKDVIMITGRFK
jgi:hypothetical protein